PVPALPALPYTTLFRSHGPPGRDAGPPGCEAPRDPGEGPDRARSVLDRRDGDHRAVRVGQAVVAHRSEQDPADARVDARPHDQHRSVLRQFDERRAGSALLDVDPAGVAGGVLGADRLGNPPGGVASRVGFVGHPRDRGPGHRDRRVDLPDVDDLQLGPAELGLLGGPPERGRTGRRLIDPDDDGVGSHDLSSPRLPLCFPVSLRRRVEGPDFPGPTAPTTRTVSVWRIWTVLAGGPCSTPSRRWPRTST